MSTYVQLFKVGRWRLGVWLARRHWTWLPNRWDSWSGKLIHRHWMCFDLLHDTRGDLLDEMFCNRQDDPQ